MYMRTWPWLLDGQSYWSVACTNYQGKIPDVPRLISQLIKSWLLPIIQARQSGIYYVHEVFIVLFVLCAVHDSVVLSITV